MVTDTLFLILMKVLNPDEGTAVVPKKMITHSLLAEFG